MLRWFRLSSNRLTDISSVFMLTRFTFAEWYELSIAGLIYKVARDLLEYSCLVMTTFCPFQFGWREDVASPTEIFEQ